MIDIYANSQSVHEGIDFNSKSVRCFLPGGGIVHLRRDKLGALFGLTTPGKLTENQYFELAKFLDVYRRFESAKEKSADFDIYEGELRVSSWHKLTHEDIERLRGGYDPELGAFE